MAVSEQQHHFISPIKRVKDLCSSWEQSYWLVKSYEEEGSNVGICYHHWLAVSGSMIANPFLIRNSCIGGRLLYNQSIITFLNFVK